MSVCVRRCWRLSTLGWRVLSSSTSCCLQYARRSRYAAPEVKEEPSLLPAPPRARPGLVDVAGDYATARALARKKRRLEKLENELLAKHRAAKLAEQAAEAAKLEAEQAAALRRREVELAAAQQQPAMSAPPAINTGFSTPKKGATAADALFKAFAWFFIQPA